jgi:platelet-activating factor acetylhydrolase
MLCIAFPAIQPPPVEGKHRVGVVDLHLPINMRELEGGYKPGHVMARIWYPTNEVGTMPYLRPKVATDYLRESILTAAPPPISRWSWFLDYWRLIRIDCKQNAKPLQLNGEKFPLVAFSHGVGGSAIIYSHQTRYLAAHGYVVVSLDHSDGSSPAVPRKDGSIQLLDKSVEEVYRAGREIEYVKLRREQTNHRAYELTGAMAALKQLNLKDIPELEGISFVGLLDTSQVHLMGHSFGAITALTAAFRHPMEITSVVAHEPATDWCPDDVRRQLFPESAISDWKDEHGKRYTGGTGGWGNADSSLTTSFGQVPTLFMFSNHWYDVDWGRCRLFEHLYKGGHLGPEGDFCVIENSFHNDFSDMCFLIPLWLTRALKVTGDRNPVDTVNEMANRTLEFLQRQAKIKKVN